MDTISKLTLICEKMQTVISGDFSLEIVDDELKISGANQNLERFWDVLDSTEILGKETIGWISLSERDNCIYVPMKYISIVPRKETKFYYVIKAGDIPTIVKKCDSYVAARQGCRKLNEAGGGNEYYYVRSEDNVLENGNLL